MLCSRLAPTRVSRRPPRPLGAGAGIAALLLLAGCASVPRPAPRPAYAGFDTWQYPGAATMRTWRAASPYTWVGVYLPAPCHRDASWSGARPELERQGWGIALLYVGQQVFEADTTGTPTSGPIVCSRSLLTEAQGRLDASDAVAGALAEGFAPGRIVYLDVERVDRIPAALVTYVSAWADGVLRDGRFLPGLYAHRDNADALARTMQVAFVQARRTETVPLWVAGGSGFDLRSLPGASGFAAATAWQGALDVTRTWGGVTLRIDENVARRPSPSGPSPR